MDESRIPILVGSGQITQREPDPARALNAMDLTAAAAKKAAADAKSGDDPTFGTQALHHLAFVLPPRRR